MVCSSKFEKMMPNLVLQLIGVILVVLSFIFLHVLSFFVNCKGRLLGAILVKNIWKKFDGKKQHYR